MKNISYCNKCQGYLVVISRSPLTE